MATTYKRQIAPISDRVLRDALARLDANLLLLSRYIVPTGVVLDWRGGTDEDAGDIPAGWLLCSADETRSYLNEFLPDGVTRNPYYEDPLETRSGRRVRIEYYRDLYAVIGHRYGGKSALGEFRLPDETPATRIIKT